MPDLTNKEPSMGHSGLEVQGRAEARFDRVRELFAHNLSSGADLGAGFAATIEGETVVDLWGGWADAARTRPWTRDTIVNVWSSTKTIMALTALVLADRGELDLGAPVARYWPEFEANGKGAITVSHFLSHSAGLSGWVEPVSRHELYDWDRMTGLLAKQEPFWEPGTACGYHSLTQGYLVGEVIRRITGKTLGAVFREEIAGPLGADFHIGLPESEDHRVAELIPPPSLDEYFDFTPTARNAFTNPQTDVLDTLTREWRAAEIPAANGHGNARSMAEIQMLLANGGVAKGKRILSEAGCRKASELQLAGTDLVFNVPARYGRGFGVHGAMIPLPSEESIFWGGYGGSLIIIDMKARATYAYAMNRMGTTTIGDERGQSMAEAMWDILAEG